MRSPVLAGVAAGLLVVILGLGALVLVVPALPASSPAPPTFAFPSPIPASPHRATFASPSRTPGAAPIVGLAPGQQAPPLSLVRLGGGTIDLAQLRGTPVWVSFMATWCPECQDELPLMEAYAPELGNAVRIVLVDVREPATTVASFAQRMQLSLPIGLDQDGKAQRSWSAYALPVHYWIDAQGIVRAVAYGSLGPSQFLAGVRHVLPGASLNP